MPDFQTLIVILIVAAAAGWLIFKFRSKPGASCDNCQHDHHNKSGH